MACCSCCSMKVAIGILLVLGSILLIVGCVLGFVVFPNMIQNIVAENVMLKEGSQSWEVWKKLPIPMQFEVYFFNVTNREEINKGEKPVLQEIGPYVYNEYKEKYDIVIDDISETAAYYQKSNFVFDPVASGGLNDTDNITIFNLALMGTLETAEVQQNSLFNFAPWDEIFPEDTDIFLTNSVKNILFDGVTFIKCEGFYNGLVCNRILEQQAGTIINGGDSLLFSLFRYKNNSADGRYEVKLGWSAGGPYPSVDGARQLGKIVRWENMTTLSKWSGAKCNQITGTDATIFPPYLTPDSRIDIFSTDLCRSLTALYDRDATFKGIDALRFTAHEQLLADVNTNPDNYCYCPPQEACLLKGALDLSPCQGAPAIVTFPHFYMADERYLKMVSGLNPSKELHETFLEIEPNTGIPLAGGKKVQFNMMMKKYDKIKLTNNVTTALFPILWINEGVSLDDADVNKLKDQLVNNLKIVAGVKWGLIAVGLCLIVVGLCLLIYVLFKGSGSRKTMFRT